MFKQHLTPTSLSVSQQGELHSNYTEPKSPVNKQSNRWLELPRLGESRTTTAQPWSTLSLTRAVTFNNLCSRKCSRKLFFSCQNNHRLKSGSESWGELCYETLSLLCVSYLNLAHSFLLFAFLLKYQQVKTKKTWKDSFVFFFTLDQHTHFCDKRV